MKNLILYESMKELKSNLMKIKFTKLKTFKEYSEDIVHIINIEEFGLKRADYIILCESIQKHISEDYGIKYMFWDKYTCGFYKITDEKMINKINEYISKNVVL